MPDTSKNSQLEQLLHAINHDLRTPLGNIRSATSILLQDLSDPLTEDQRLFIEIIDRSTLRLLDQSNRLLLFGQIVFEQTQITQTLLSDLLANAKKELKNYYDIDDVTFITNGDPFVMCHAHTLSALLALLAAGDTKQQPDTPAANDPPTIHTISNSAKVKFSVLSQMPAYEFANSFNELADEIVKRHGGHLESAEENGRKLFTFDLPLVTPEN